MLCKAGRGAEARTLSQPFLAFEKVRLQLGGIQVLHDGLRLSGIADTGPLMPMVSNLPADMLGPVQAAVDALKIAETQAIARQPT
jgi:dihydrodipicolinate synthase/N-acetylneuraminate lyase